MKVDERPEEEGTTYLIVDRKSRISRWGKGNNKLGPSVFTYDRLPSKVGGTCPGSTEECESICYAKRLAYNAPVWDLLRRNSENDTLPELPSSAKLVRIHVSGDFDTPSYVIEWINMVRRHPDVTFWGYTRSWRVSRLYELLVELRDQPNVQLFASVDESSASPPQGWRKAWIDGDRRLVEWGENFRQEWFQTGPEDMRLDLVSPAYVCPEETGRKKDCESCGYCFHGKRGDVVFLKH